MKTIARGLIFVLIFSVFLGTLSGCNLEKNQEFKTMDDFSRAKIGALTGSVFDLLADEYFPEAEKFNFINNTDLILNLNQGKIDGILMDKGYFASLNWENEGFSSIEMDMPATEYAVAFPKDADSELLKNEMNSFIEKQTENGWLQELHKKWFADSEPDMLIDFSQLDGKNGTLRVATCIELRPFDYLKDGKFYGYDAEFLFRFAKEYGYAVEIETMDFGAIIPSISANRYDFAISGITITEERKESISFSDTYCSCSIAMAVLGKDDEKEMTLADLNNATLGIVTGTSWDIIAQKQFPDAEREYFPSTTDVLLALEQGKVDAFFTDKTVYTGLSWENKGIACIDEPVKSVSNALIFAKDGHDPNLLNQVNTFIAESKSNGFLDELSEKWFGNSEPLNHPDYSKLTGENGTLKIAAGNSMKPTSYQKGSFYTGYEIDFLTRFAEEHGYMLEIEGMTFEAIIPSVSSGKSDIGVSGITITPERKESVVFSEPLFETTGVAVIGNDANTRKAKKTVADYENAVIGVLTGSVYETYAKKLFPNAERKYYTLASDTILALEQGKIDAFLNENTYVTALRWEGVEVETVDEFIDQTHAGYIFNKNPKNKLLLGQMNEFIRNSKENGYLDELKAKWLGKTEPDEFPDVNALEGENGTIRVAVAPDTKPMCYIKDNIVVGYDVELLIDFAKEYGYKLDLTSLSFEGILPGVISGKYDMGASGLTITEERAQSVDFSDSIMTVDVVLITSKSDGGAEVSSLWSDVKEGFNKTFIRENRWKLIVEGICVTILISFLSVLFGTLLGFCLYLLSRSDVKLIKKIVKGVLRVYSRIISGTPVVVILMMLFYVVFSEFRDMSGIVVAIIGFSLCFGAFVCDHLSVSVSSVDYGQTEAAYALSYTKNKAFYRIVLPQAMKIFMPSYCGQCVDLIKSTAVVGYIAVNDLTKMGDIIRSNTYEAFFPLIAVAVIYFIITWIIELLLNSVRKKFEPKRRSAKKILKGVK